MEINGLIQTPRSQNAGPKGQGWKGDHETLQDAQVEGGVCTPHFQWWLASVQPPSVKKEGD